MPTISLELIRDAFRASVISPSSERRNDSSEYFNNSSDDESFHDAYDEIPEDDTGTSITDDESVDASEYTKAYAEIARIFEHLNMAFAFVGQNLKESCELINTVVSELGNKPVSLEQALEYDKRVDLKYNVVSCVLWLHRPLEFIIALFRGLAEPSEENATEIAKRCYSSTLGQHHAWPVQQMVNVLLLTLPTKEEMLNNMEHENEAYASMMLLEVADISQIVYDRVQRMVERLKLK